MAKERHLTNAPIVEAIIDFRASLSDQTTISTFDQHLPTMELNYPNKSPLIENSIDLQFNKEKFTHAQHEQGTVGYRYDSIDATQIVQFRLNGFSVSRLKPYQDWSQLKQEAESLWAMYSELAKPQKIDRIATRYINVMPIPLPIDDIEDVLTVPPRSPGGLKQQLRSFLARVVSEPKDSTGTTAIVTQAFDSIEDNNAIFILDIDVFLNCEFVPDSSDCWEELEKLRILKNKLFFESITDRTAELFK